MFDFLRENQLNIMLNMSGICGMIAIFVGLTKPIPKSRRNALLVMALAASLLMISDRNAYQFRGDVSTEGYWMVRISNYTVFAMTMLVEFGFSLYLIDMCKREVGLEKGVRRLVIANILIAVGEAVLLVSQFTGLYYTFDESNRYQRAPGFIFSYIVPILVPILQITVIAQFYDKFSRVVRFYLILFVVIPILASIAQIFVYGLSLTNLCVSFLVITLYISVIVDMNRRAQEVHEKEITFIAQENKDLAELFDQTAKALVAAIDAKDNDTKDYSAHVAEWSRELAKQKGMSEEEQRDVYYAALLHDIGKLGIPDAIVTKEGALTEEEEKIVRQKPIIGQQILSGLKEYPNLSIGAYYGFEKYNGSGYPNGLSGEEIPEMARIVSVADAYVHMTSKSRTGDALPMQVVREEFIKESGGLYDPDYSEMMVHMIDEQQQQAREEGSDLSEWESELSCEEYRSQITHGIPVTPNWTEVTFRVAEFSKKDGEYSLPSVIVFDSYDGCVHDNPKLIKAYRYTEYAEVWYDGNAVDTTARCIQVEPADLSHNAEMGSKEELYTLEFARFEDQMILWIRGGGSAYRVVIALPDGSVSAYISLTGEHCRLYDIAVIQKEEEVLEEEIPRIADPVSYINRLEYDLPNIQVNRNRAASTKGIVCKDSLRIKFHTMSLPSASFVWNCPYLVFFYSEDQMIYGPGYREYALIKLNGEITGNEDCSTNHYTVTRTDDFVNWETWNRMNKEGFECTLQFRRSGRKVSVVTTNLGIAIDAEIKPKEKPPEIYMALTGDLCAITDIQIYG